jgi:hypothetical protein
MAAGAGAHGGGRSQGYVATVSTLEPNVLGVLVNVYGPANRLQVSNYSGKTVVILGYQREPYLRFTGARVEENVASPTAYVNTSRTVPTSADASSKPQWRQIALGASYSWHDHRTVWRGSRPPLVVRRAPDKPHLIFRWAHLRHGERRAVPDRRLSRLGP